MTTATVNPIQNAEVPEGFTKEELRQFGWCLINAKVQIGWTRNFEKLGGKGPFHILGRKIDKWAVTLEEAIEIARKC